MHVFTILQPYLLSIVIALCVLLACGIPLVLYRWRTRRQPAAASDTPLSSPSALRLRQSFRRALALLRRHVPGRHAPYQIPWFLLLGEAASGKTTLLQGAGLNMPFGTPTAETLARKAGCTWWFFDHGIVLDTDGDYVLRAESGTSDARGWRALLRLLQRHRPARPLDGIIVAIPCTDLIGPPEQHTSRLARATHKATLLYEKLWEAQRVLGLRLPVYVLITRCDQISGFQSFCEALPTRLHQDIFGWSNPYTLEAAYVPHWVDEAFETLGEQLAHLQLEVMAEGTPLEDGDGFFLFPHAFQAVREPLRAYVDHLFTSSAYHEAFFFRGLYFCGDGRLDVPRALAPTEPAEEAMPVLPVVPMQTRPVAPQTNFLKQLFDAKIFPEHRLANPAAKTLVTRSRAVLTAQILLLLMVLIGGLGLWRGYRGMVAAKETLQPVLREIALDVERHRGKAAMSDAQFSKETLNLLKGMSQANASGLQSVFFPASWFDPIHTEIIQALTAAYSTVILQSMVREFQHKAHHLLQAGTRRSDLDPGSLQHVPIDRTPEFITLQNFTEAWAELEKYAALYNRHVVAAGANDLQALGQVVKYLFGSDVPPDFYRNAHYYQEALAQASGELMQLATYRQTARTKAQGLVKALYDRLFATNPPLVAVQHLAQVFERLKRQRPAEVTTQTLRGVVDAITQTQTVLHKPEFAWLTSASPDFGEAFERLVSTMAGVEVLGPELSTEFRQAGEAAWQKFQLALHTQRASIVGPLLQLDGEPVRLGLAPGVLALKDALSHFVQLEFVRREAQRAMRTELLPKTHLIWDVRALEDAIRLYEPYSRFRSEDLRHFPADMIRQVEAVAVRHLRANLSDLMAQAQILAPTPDSFGQARVEAGMSPEIRNLQGATPLLGRLVDICNDAGLGDMSWALLSLVSAQALGLLDTVDQLLESEHPYAVKDGNFAWWHGTAAPSVGAFEVRDSKELGAYLTLQRDRLRHFAQAYAEPLVAFVTHRPRQRTPRQAALLAKWQAILAELESYDNKKPGNAVSALEAFIGQDMEQLTTHNCLQALGTQNGAARANDFFSQHRSALHRELSKRCHVLTQELVGQEYGRIANLFNQRLAGKFPFTDGAVGEHDLEADPHALRDFYQVFDQSARVVRDLLRSTKTAAARDQALAFLDQMDAVRTFFVPFLDGDAQQPGPVFDLAIDFRVNKARERGGNQIIDWQLSVGEQPVRTRDAERQGRWHFGDPIQMVLRWAKDAPVEPYVNGNAAQADVKDGAAVFAYTNRWSLLRLLRNHASAAADFERFADPKPHTLKFVVDTRAKQDKAAASVPTVGTEARVFIGVTVMAPDKKERLILPPMPVRAPELPLKHSG